MTHVTRKQTTQHHRQARVQVKTFDAEARTVDVCFTTGAKGKRFSWWTGETFYEELEVSEAACKLERLNAGAAVLNSHNAWDLNSQIGVVERAWIDGEKGYATIRLSDREDVAGIVRDIANGIIRNVSVGYTVARYQDVTASEDEKFKTYRAVDWEPCEVSFVAVPFDAGAQSRSKEKSGEQPTLFEVEIIETTRGQAGTNLTRESDMGEKNPTPTPAPAPTQVDLEAEKRAAAEAATAAERTRAAGIRDACRKLGLDEKLAEEHVNKGTAVEAFRALAIEAKATADESSNTRTANAHVTVGGQDEHVVRAAGMETALLHRSSPTNKLDDNGRRFSGMSLVEMARMHLEAHGVRTVGMNRVQIAEKALQFRAGMHSTSDFPYILANVANKALMTGYAQLEAKQTFLPLVKPAFTPDFKQVSRVARGEAPTPSLVPEGAEITYGTIGERREVYTIGTYAKIIAITEEAIVNDDLGAFTSLPRDMGAACARLESDVVWSIFTANAAMGDTVALFDSGHGNVGTSGVISIATIAELEEKMMLQTGINGANLDIRPKYLIVPVNLKAVAEQFVSQNLMASESGKVNPYAGRLTVIAEPRLDGTDTTDWYMAADPNDGVDIIETLKLEGTSGPVTSMKDGWDRNGVEVKVKHYFGAKALDWRGVAMNEGGS